jgi:hypothetical protein
MSREEDMVVILDDDARPPVFRPPPVKVAEVDETPLAGHEVKADGSVTVRLAWPVSLTVKTSGGIADRRFETLTFRRLTGADMRAVNGAPEATRIPMLFARSTGIAQAMMDKLFDKLDAADIVACTQVIDGFLGSGRPTGRS